MKWFKGSEELKPSPKYNMEVTPRTAVLTVKGAEKEDESAYRAELENDLGKEKADMKAEVVENEGRTILSLLRIELHGRQKPRCRELGFYTC